MSEAEAQEIRDRKGIIDTIGNLTLVTQPLNSAISHGPLIDNRFEPERGHNREQALIGYTRTAAYSVFAEEKLGTLEPGKLADLAVLWEDIFQVSNTELPKDGIGSHHRGGKIALLVKPSSSF